MTAKRAGFASGEREKPCEWTEAPLPGGRVQVTAGGRAEVTRHALLAPAQVVHRRDVGEQREPLLVTEERAGLEQPRRIDDERRLAVCLAALHEAGDSFEGAQLATPRIS